MEQVQEVTDDPRPAPRIATEDEVVREHFLKVCVACKWNKKRVAELLGLAEKTVYNRLNRYELEGFIEPVQDAYGYKVKEQKNADGTATDAA